MSVELTIQVGTARGEGVISIGAGAVWARNLSPPYSPIGLVKSFTERPCPATAGNIAVAEGGLP